MDASDRRIHLPRLQGHRHIVRQPSVIPSISTESRAGRYKHTDVEVAVAHVHEMLEELPEPDSRSACRPRTALCRLGSLPDGTAWYVTWAAARCG
ncbi:hypothetical protein STRMOE7_05790 [Streptomyces sp. MOE7]|nr:hypothetical protein STRMOE7_05790 [Streptomyces sp. MOE7]